MKINKWLISFSIILSTISLVVCCVMVWVLIPQNIKDWFKNEYEGLIFYETGYSFINPDTILKSLNQGKTDVFDLQVGDSQIGYAVVSGEVQWSQDDYLQIARGLFETVWEESFENWEFNRLFFRMNCEQAHRQF